MNGQAFPQEANGLGNLVTNCKLKLGLNRDSPHYYYSMQLPHHHCFDKPLSGYNIHLKFQTTYRQFII